MILIFSSREEKEVDLHLAKSELPVVGFAAARKISCRKIISGLLSNEVSSSS